jgi:LEA14-like dessication related protein
MRHAFIALLLASLAACTGMPFNALPPQVSVTEIDPKSLGLFEQRFELGLRVGNPNAYELRIEALEFELELNARPFARGSVQGATLIPAESAVLLRAEAVTESRQLLEQLRALSPEALTEGMPYRIKGRLRTTGWSGWLPFEYGGVYGGDAQARRAKTI